MESIKEHCESSVCTVLVGNKNDLASEREVSANGARDLAKSYNMEYFDVTAKLNAGVTEFFEALMNQIYKKHMSG
jgi:GTPase SAR1 family protein